MTVSAAQPTHSPQYGRILDKLGARACVVLDGATATELPHLSDAEHAIDARLWGTRALVEESSAVLDVHRGYVEAGCDVISTNTWGLPSALLDDGPRLWESPRPIQLMEIAPQGVRL